MHDKTFEELYCERHSLAPHEFTDAVLNETLYPQARMLKRFLPGLAARRFAVDVEFVHSVGLLRRFRDYTLESEEFAQHPENRGFWRVTANFRVSTRRMRRLVRSTLHPELAPGEVVEDRTAAPFGNGSVKMAAPSRDMRSNAG